MACISQTRVKNILWHIYSIDCICNGIKFQMYVCMSICVEALEVWFKILGISDYLSCLKGSSVLGINSVSCFCPCVTCFYKIFFSIQDPQNGPAFQGTEPRICKTLGICLGRFLLEVSAASSQSPDAFRPTWPLEGFFFNYTRRQWIDVDRTSFDWRLDFANSSKVVLFVTCANLSKSNETACQKKDRESHRMLGW